jgi:hypothetical protein
MADNRRVRYQASAMPGGYGGISTEQSFAGFQSTSAVLYSNPMTSNVLSSPEHPYTSLTPLCGSYSRLGVPSAGYAFGSISEALEKGKTPAWFLPLTKEEEDTILLARARAIPVQPTLQVQTPKGTTQRG